MESLAIGKNVIKMAVRRIFAAIDISDEARDHIAAYSKEIGREFRDVKVRWELPEKFHITLRFEAKADVEMLGHMETLIKSAATLTPPFELTIAGTGVFVNRRGPTILWIGIGANEELNELARLMSNSGEKVARKFRPHLTIARIKDPVHAGRLIERHKTNTFAASVSPVREILLYESTLEPSGSKYSVLLREKLMG